MAGRVASELKIKLSQQGPVWYISWHAELRIPSLGGMLRASGGVDVTSATIQGCLDLKLCGMLACSIK